MSTVEGVKLEGSIDSRHAWTLIQQLMLGSSSTPELDIKLYDQPDFLAQDEGKYFFGHVKDFSFSAGDRTLRFTGEVYTSLEHTNIQTRNAELVMRNFRAWGDEGDIELVLE